MWNYIIPALTLSLAFMQLLKDWKAHEKWWRRIAVFILIVGLGVAGMVNVRKASDQGNTIRNLTSTIDSLNSKTTALESAVKTANTNQVQNTKVFTESLERFSSKLSTLETEVQTADLRNEAARLRADLNKTQQALATPRATLTAGLVESSGDVGDPHLFGHVEVLTGQPIPLAIRLVNNSDVSAHKIFLGFRVCAECKFHVEPPGSSHPDGQPEYERTWAYEVATPHTSLPVQQVLLDVPATASSLQIAFFTTCDNCNSANKWDLALVTITRLGAPKKATDVKPQTK
jgi:hypothetical protein